MISVKGLFDGKTIKLIEKVDIQEPQEVIITFLGAIKDKEIYHGIYKIAETGGSFDFLNSSEEDIYSDDDLKVKLPAASRGASKRNPPKPLPFLPVASHGVSWRRRVNNVTGQKRLSF